MSVDHMPARTTTRAASGTRYGTATRTATVLDGAHVRQYRDWRQTGTNLALAVAVPASAGSVALFAAEQHLLVAKVLTVIAGLSAPAALCLHREFTASVRRWVYAPGTRKP